MFGRMKAEAVREIFKREGCIYHKAIKGDLIIENAVLNELSFRRNLLYGMLYFKNVKVNGYCHISAIIKGDLLLDKVEINGPLFFENAIIRKSLKLSNVDIKGFVSGIKAIVQGDVVFRAVRIHGDLVLSDAELRGDLRLLETNIEGPLDLSTKIGPRRIFVDSELREEVHLAAPNVPLIVMKKS